MKKGRTLTIEDIERARKHLEDTPAMPYYIPVYGLDDETLYMLLKAGVRLLLHPSQVEGLEKRLNEEVKDGHQRNLYQDGRLRGDTSTTD